MALMGDIPFGVSYYSADVFSRADEFLLDWFGGAPPEPHFKDDAFTQKWGQNWGIPLYRWSAMRANNFQWWRERVRGTRRIFHLFRIDHVQGFYRVYAFPWRPERNKEFLPLDQHQMLERTGGRAPHFVPRDDDTPEHREANKREGEEYLRVIMDEAGAARVAGKILVWCPITCGPVCNRLASRDSKFRNGKSAMEWSFPGKCTSGCPLRRTRHTITNRFELYGNSYSSIKTPIRSDKRALH